VVISSYLVANEQRVRRGVAIAFLSALVQALVAIGIVGLMAVVLNMTSMAITDTAKLFETGSFALVAALGIYLLARKGRQAWAMAQGGDAHAHHGHDHSAGCACSHHGAPAVIKPGASGAAAAILSVGIRPCTGALVVLVFALAQGIFWAGIASTFLMALGTAITVAALAALAVGAKDIAARLVRGDARRAGQVMLGLELLAAAAITVLGAVLFFGSVAA
jgi:ABC-type nickel/cobalt efflux system permease component RcnA